MNSETGTLFPDSENPSRRPPLVWNVADLARALKIDEKEVKDYFTDGRRVSFLLERRVAKRLAWALAPSESAGFDLQDDVGGHWEVRCISKRGVYFSPSKDVGSKRKFTEKGLRAKIASLAGYVLCDIVSFPRIPFWIIRSEDVIVWLDSGRLGKRAYPSRETILLLLGNG